MAEHTELKREVSKLGTMLEAKASRIRDLEGLLKSTREAANREYHRLQQEREKTRLAFFTKLKDRESERVIKKKEREREKERERIKP